MEKRIDELTAKMYRVVLERFGEPIGKAAAVPGVPDEREDEGTELTGNRTVRPLDETRFNVSPDEVVTTWEDLYGEMGSVSLEELASWVASTSDVVEAALPDWLYVDEAGNVVEKVETDELGAPDVSESKKGPSKKGAKNWVKGTKKFSDKVKKAKKAGMKNPEGFAAWMQHKATGKWPSKG
jgi:hypothetical protein